MDENPTTKLLEQLKTAKHITEQVRLPQSVKQQIKLSEQLSKSFQTPLPNVNRVGMDLKKSMDELHEFQQQEKQREKEYKESVLNALLGIEKNTALLTEMTLLLQKSNDRQDEVFAIIVEVLEILKSSSQEEADSRFAKVMGKITTFKENVSTMQSLYGLASAAFNAYQGLPF